MSGGRILVSSRAFQFATTAGHSRRRADNVVVARIARTAAYLLSGRSAGTTFAKTP